MRPPYGYYENDKYKVCMTGTLWIYNSNEQLIGRFTETPYSYKGAFVPGTNLFMSRTNECHIVIYDLDKMQMVRKIKTSNVGASEGSGFCFSPDGKLFYCIEAHWNDWLSHQLSIYRVPDFERIKTCFAEEQKMLLEFIETDEVGDYYVIGFDRGSGTTNNFNFTGRFVNDSIVDKRELHDDWMQVVSYFEWKLSGFTEKTGAVWTDQLNEGIMRLSGVKTIKDLHKSGHLFDNKTLT